MTTKTFDLTFNVGNGEWYYKSYNSCASVQKAMAFVSSLNDKDASEWLCENITYLTDSNSSCMIGKDGNTFHFLITVDSNDCTTEELNSIYAQIEDFLNHQKWCGVDIKVQYNSLKYMFHTSRVYDSDELWVSHYKMDSMLGSNEPAVVFHDKMRGGYWELDQIKEFERLEGRMFTANEVTDMYADDEKW